MVGLSKRWLIQKQFQLTRIFVISSHVGPAAVSRLARNRRWKQIENYCDLWLCAPASKWYSKPIYTSFPSLRRSMRTPTKNIWHFALVQQSEYVINGVRIAMDCILSSTCNNFAQRMTLLAPFLPPSLLFTKSLLWIVENGSDLSRLIFPSKEWHNLLAHNSTIHVEWFMDWHISIYISEVCRFCADDGANCATIYMNGK